jgi:hypothetical protein
LSAADNEATASPRYQLVDRWSSTNSRYGWVVWDTKRDRPASGWHRDQHHLARACDVLNGAGETRHESYLEVIQRVGVDRG